MRIAFAVIILHLVFCALLAYRLPTAPKLPPKPIAVRFIQETAPPVKIEKVIQDSPKPSAPKPQPVAASKKPKPSVPKPVAVTKKPAPPVSKPISPPKKDNKQLLALMKESLNALDGKKEKTPDVKTKPLGPLASESLHLQSSYEDLIISSLEESLELPEKGEVKIKLTLTRDGAVKQVHIENAPSQKNRDYVEKALSAHFFPPFGGRFKGELAHTFSIRLKSEHFN